MDGSRRCSRLEPHAPWPERASALVQGYGREPVVARTSASNDGTAELVRILRDPSALFTSSAK